MVSLTIKNCKKNGVSVVVPVFNEEDNIQEFYMRITKTLDNVLNDYEIIFVDDGSKDNSLDVLRGLCLDNKKIRVVILKNNFGQSAAILAGFKYATRFFIIVMDVDLQCPPEEVSKLIDKLDEGFDAVGGYRRKRQDTFLLRRLPSFYMNKLINLRAGIKAKDWGCSFGALRRDIADKVLFYGKRARFVKPLIAKIAMNSTEVEISHFKRKNGKSKYTFFSLFVEALDFLINYRFGFSKNDDLPFVVKEIL